MAPTPPRHPPPPTRFGPAGFAAPVAQPRQTAPLPPPGHGGTTVQRLYGNNVPAQFTTGMGSTYTVTANQVTRNKFDGTVHTNPKNIFYVTGAVKNQISANKGTWVNPRVSRGFFNTTLNFTTAGGIATSLALSTKPAIGLIPLDMLLQANGDLAPAHRLHYGHPITVITPQPGCCFITTACVETMGLADDCTELTILRGFRDGWLMAQPEGPEMIATYYRRAPELLAAITASRDGNTVLRELYQVVAKCAALVTAGHLEQARDAYVAMMAELERSHGGGADGLILAGQQRPITGKETRAPMAHVIFYEKPGCGGNSRQKQTLSASGHVLEVRDLLSHPWQADELLAFLSPLPPAEWFNRSAPRVKSGEIVPEALSAEQALDMLLAEHLLIRRPLMQVGDDRMVGWDEAKVAAWIGLDPAGIGEGCPKGEHAPKCEPPKIA